VQGASPPSHQRGSQEIAWLHKGHLQQQLRLLAIPVKYDPARYGHPPEGQMTSLALPADLEGRRALAESFLREFAHSQHQFSVCYPLIDIFSQVKVQVLVLVRSQDLSCAWDLLLANNPLQPLA
jgi:hypothetical protein